MATIALLINGTERPVTVEPDRTLLDVLRDEIGLTGAKYGCGEARCGACTVLVGDRAVRSCVTRATSAAGKPITTIEGLERNGRLHPVQDAFLSHEALQCGYCTPGMIMSAVALLRSNADPTRDQIVRAMDGNVCRCAIYSRIVSAIEEAAGAIRAAGDTAGGAR
jgi:aerobic-type carbon monoxide dehydrogenase small subunit (CoxS/CutS family)